MNPEILSTTEEDGTLLLQLRISPEDIEAARIESHDQLAFENGLDSVEALRTLVGPGDLGRFEMEYTLSKAVNMAVKQLGVRPCVSSEIDSKGMLEAGKPYEFSVTVYPRPEIALTSAEPIKLTGRRIPAPGESIEDAKAGKDVKFVADEQLLRIEIPGRLVARIPEPLLTRAMSEHGQSFAENLVQQGSSVEDYISQMGMSEDELRSLMTMEASKHLQFDLALDAFYEALGLEITDEDVDEILEKMLPGQGAQLRGFYERHGDLFIIEDQARRRKAYDWIVAHVE